MKEKQDRFNVLCATVLEVALMNEEFNIWNDNALIKKLENLGSGIIIYIKNGKFDGHNYKDGVVWYNGKFIPTEEDYITYKEFKGEKKNELLD